jgi:hypothetical protein
MTTDIFTIIANGTTYDGNNISSLYYKSRLNQVGRFEFDGIGFDATDVTNFAANTIIIIYVNGVNRFEGYVQKIKLDKTKGYYHIEGQSLGGIFATKVSTLPILVKRTDWATAGDWRYNYAKTLIAYILFEQCGFSKSGDSGFSVVGGNGAQFFYYKVEQRTALDHITNLSKISGYDWRVYLGPVE